MWWNTSNNFLKEVLNDISSWEQQLEKVVKYQKLTNCSPTSDSRGDWLKSRIRSSSTAVQILTVVTPTLPQNQKLDYTCWISLCWIFSFWTPVPPPRSKSKTADLKQKIPTQSIQLTLQWTSLMEKSNELLHLCQHFIVRVCVLTYSLYLCNW